MKRPHLIIFNPDSFRGDVVGHLGNAAAYTPHLDALVDEGAVSYRHAYCQNPVCVPSRCSFMSGQYPHVHGHRTMSHARHAERDQGNILQTLKASGYFVWWGGKNDLVPGNDGWREHADVYFKPTDEDFARWGVTPHDLAPEETWRGATDSDTYYSFMRGLLPGFAPDEVRVDGDWGVIRAAVEFLESYSGDQPLCMFLAISAPHPQYCVEPRFYNCIDPDKIPPRVTAASLDGPEPSLRAAIRQRQNMEPSWTEERWRELRRVYYGMCARVDHFFGDVVDALKHTQRYDDSAVFFFSDHGDFTGDYGLVEKSQNTFEDCLTKVPFVVKPPRGVPMQAGIRDDLIELIDFTATAFDLCGVEPAYDYFGKSLRESIAGKVDSHRDAVFCEGGRLESETHCCETETGAHNDVSNKYWPKVRTQQDLPEHGKAAMCRTQDFKYIRRPFEDDQLFDLLHDPFEQRNLVRDPAYSTTLDQHRERMLDWYINTCDVVPRKHDGRSMAR